VKVASCMAKSIASLSTDSSSSAARAGDTDATTQAARAVARRVRIHRSPENQARGLIALCFLFPHAAPLGRRRRWPWQFGGIELHILFHQLIAEDDFYGVGVIKCIGFATAFGVEAHRPAQA